MDPFLSYSLNADDQYKFKGNSDQMDSKLSTLNKP